MDGGLQTSRTGLNVASKAEGVVTNYSLELFLLWVVRVVHRTVVTELARRNDGFTPGKTPPVKRPLLAGGDRKIFYVQVLRSPKPLFW